MVSLISPAEPSLFCWFYRLVHLDLIMFGVSAALADVLQLLSSLRTLVIWPVEVFLLFIF